MKLTTKTMTKRLVLPKQWHKNVERCLYSGGKLVVREARNVTISCMLSNPPRRRASVIMTAIKIWRNLQYKRWPRYESCRDNDQKCRILPTTSTKVEKYRHNFDDHNMNSITTITRCYHRPLKRWLSFVSNCDKDDIGHINSTKNRKKCVAHPRQRKWSHGCYWSNGDETTNIAESMLIL